MAHEGYVTIRLKIATRDMLRDLGKKGDTYEQIINRLYERAKAGSSKARS